MFQFTLTFNGGNYTGQGKRPIGAFDNLMDNLKKNQLFIGRREELLEFALTAAAYRDCVIESNQPETEFTLVFKKIY